jgi:hypothetical protein
MARIRTIKPEFWSDEKLSPMSAIDRLTFLGLISMADDYGRVQDNVKIIDAFVFPNSDDTVRESLANLSRMNRIVRGKSSSGMPIIEIVNWGRHQKVDKPQPKLALPAISVSSDLSTNSDNKKQGSNNVRESVANDSRGVRESVAPLTTDQDPDQLPPTPSRSSGSVRECPPNAEEVGAYMAIIGKDAAQAQAFVDYYTANGWVQGSESKPIKDWHSQVRIWFRKEEERNKSSPGNRTAQRTQDDIPAESMFAQ